MVEEVMTMAGMVTARAYGFEGEGLQAGAIDR